MEYVESEGVSLCDCPHCSGRIMSTDHMFKCTNGDFSIQRAVCGHDLTDSEMVQLINGDVVSVICKKEDKSWPQKLSYNVETKRIEFYRESTDYKCPCCHKAELYSTEKSLKCPDCNFVLWKTVASVELTKEQIEKLLIEGKTEKIDGFRKKDGQKFKKPTALVLNKRKKAVEFDFAKKK